MEYKLQKSLYGLKQTSSAWFSIIESDYIKEVFESSSGKQTLFVKRKRGKIPIVSIYVDNLLFTENDEELIRELKCFMKEFNMTDLGQMSFVLNIKVIQRSDGILYVKGIMLPRSHKKITTIFVIPLFLVKRLIKMKMIQKWMQLCIRLMYLTTTRPNLMFVVSLLSHFMESHT